MIVREIEVELDGDLVGAAIWRNFSEECYHAVLGSFDPENLLVTAVAPDVPTDTPGTYELDAFIDKCNEDMRAIANRDAKISYLIGQTTWQHELIHFHDMLCTPFGALSFMKAHGRRFGILNAMALLGRDRRVGEPSIDPDTERERRAEIISRIARLRLEEMILNGDFDKAWGPTSLHDFDIVWANCTVDGRDLRIPYFPSQAIVDGEKRCLLIPMGLRAVVEMRAVCWQSLHIRSFGPDYVTPFMNMLSGEEYRVLNRFITRVLKNNGAFGLIDGDGHGFIFEILSAALFCLNPERPEDGLISNIVRELRAADPSSGIRDGIGKEIVDAAVWAIPIIEAASPFPDVNPEAPFIEMVRYVHDCYRSAVKVYREGPTDGALRVGSLDGYFLNFGSLPGPFIANARGRVAVRAGAEDLDQETWRRIVSTVSSTMYNSIINQFHTEDDFVCPVVEGVYAEFLRGIGIHSNCRDGVATGNCGRVRQGQDISEHCDCLWKHHVSELGIVSLQDGGKTAGRRARP